MSDGAPLQLHPVDLADDAVMHAAGRLLGRSRAVDRPHAPEVVVPEWVAVRRAPDSGERTELLGAWAGGELVGFGVSWSFVLDNTDKAVVDVDVDPAHRGRGVGSALLAAQVDRIRADGRAQVLAECVVPLDQRDDHPYRRFAARHGFRFSNVEVVRHQALPVPEDRLAGWEAQAAERASAYRVETHVGEFPEELRASLCELLSLLAVDAPTGEATFEAEVFTPERFAERYAESEAAGRDLYESVALAPDGTVVAQSTMQVRRHAPDALQWGTYVHRDHRGHRLGLAVKVATLRAVQERAPHVRRAITQNAETNAWMIAINEQLGFEPVEASVELLLDL